MKSYKAMCLEDVRNVGYYLEKLIQTSVEEFSFYQNYYMEHFAEVDIPYDFTEYNSAKTTLLRMLCKSDNPLFFDGSEISFDSLTHEEREAYFIYLHEFWLLTFEEARAAFNLPYTYYLVPKEDEFKMVYMVDGERTHKGPDGSKADEGEFLYLGDEYLDPPEKYPVQWNTWFTGEVQDDFQVWDNQWGHTYACYVPLFINGKKLGLIGAEIQVENVNKAILHNTLWQVGAMAVGLFLFLLVLMLFVNYRYVQRVITLEAQMREYSIEKDPEIVSRIKENIRGHNEISLLCARFADMVLEIEDYIVNLLATRKELQITKHHANLMNELANKDALTGVRNKNAYDSEIIRLEEKLAHGKKEFGIVMIDLNYLKHINDTYGHDQGNIAIKKLCQLVCDVFVHSPVFRIGGDEFVVILENSAYKNINSLVLKLNESLEALKSLDNLDEWEKISAAVGFALYNEDTDEDVASVFKRADKAMYERKRAMKAIRKA